MGSHTELKGFNEIGEALLSDQIEANLVSFFEWGLLAKGAFLNIEIPSSGAFGGGAHRLRLVKEDENYEDGRVFEGFRSDWVWQTGIPYSRQPISISGVFVDGVFQPTSGVGAYAHHIDYPNGRVVFDSPIDTDAVVTCEYSTKLFHFSPGDSPWWKQIQFDSYRVDSVQFLQDGSGNWSIPGPNRIQLPHVVVEAVPKTDRVPLQIGDDSFIVTQDVLFHILTETPWDKKTLHDVITYQTGKRLVAFDKNLMISDSGYPLDYDGSLRDGAKTYPDLVKASGDGGYGWKQLRIIDARGVDQTNSPPLYYCTVRMKVEIDLP